MYLNTEDAYVNSEYVALHNELVAMLAKKSKNHASTAHAEACVLQSVKKGSKVKSCAIQ